jgi:uncharacterized protein YaiI (UPF0178 family)
MTLFIDGDAFPNLLKAIILRAINKNKIKTIVVANKKINIGKSEYIESIVVPLGADVADQKIVELSIKSDLIITADIPLADELISKDAHAIDHRGELYTKDNIKQYLAVRDLMQSIRDSGEQTKGPKPFGQKDANSFANQFNKFLQNNYNIN